MKKNMIVTIFLGFFISYELFAAAEAKLVILTSSSLQPEASKYAINKNILGFETTVLTVAANQSGPSLRKLIRNNTSAGDYVLLFGETNTIKTFEHVLNYGALFQSDLELVIDTTKIYYYYTPTPEIVFDFSRPRSWVGRFPIRNSTEAKYVAYKTLLYETMPHWTTNTPYHSLYHIQGNQSWFWQFSAKMWVWFYNHNWTFVSNLPDDQCDWQFINDNDFLNVLDDDYHYIYHCSHADVSCLSTHVEYNVYKIGTSPEKYIITNPNPANDYPNNNFGLDTLTCGNFSGYLWYDADGDNIRDSNERRPDSNEVYISILYDGTWLGSTGTRQFSTNGYWSFTVDGGHSSAEIQPIIARKKSVNHIFETADIGSDYSNDVPNIPVRQMPFIFFNTGCEGSYLLDSGGRMDQHNTYSSYDYKSVNEVLMSCAGDINNVKGPCAVWGQSYQSVNWSKNDSFFIALENGSHRLHPLCMRMIGKAAISGVTLESIGHSDYTKCTVLLGDPSMHVWKDAPLNMTISSVTVNSSSVNITMSGVSDVRLSAKSVGNASFYESIVDADGNYTFNTSVRPLLIGITKTDYKPKFILTGGTLDKDLWLVGDIFVTGDLTIPSGKTVEILPKTTLTFKPNSDDQNSGLSTSKAEIITSGTLTVDKASFSGSLKGSWYGIRFTSSASASSYLKNCTIENPVIGIYIDGSDPTIEKCDIKSCDDWGIYVSSSSAWPKVIDNYIQADLVGIYHYNVGADGGQYAQNSIKTAGTGVYATSGQAIFQHEDDTYKGRNKFESSIGGNRVYITGGTPWFGASSDYGNNYFTKPSSSTYKYIKNTSANTIYAENNYFYQCPTPDASWFQGSIDREPKLANPPANPPAGPTWTPKSAQDFLVEYFAIRKEYNEASQESAEDALIDLTAAYQYTEFAAYSLDLLLGLSDDRDTDTRALTNSLSNDSKVSEKIKFVIDKWESRRAYQNGDVTVGEKMLDKYTNSMFASEMGFIHAAGLAQNGNKKQASELIEQYFTDRDAPEILESLLKSIEMDVPIAQGSQNASDNGADLALGLYPNPFNANIRITFYLAEAKPVILDIYNILGQKVVSLADGSMPAGSHGLSWNGRNEYGQPVASGIYLIRFQAGKLSKIVKVVYQK